jgi:hypothetical protein
VNPTLKHHGRLTAWLLPFNQLASDPILHWLRYTNFHNSIEERYGADLVMRRVFSLVRKFDYRSLLIEEITVSQSPLLAEEN